MPTVKYVTCTECKTDWTSPCGLCKSKPWMVKKIKRRKKPIKHYGNIVYRDEIKRSFWNDYHPRRVVSLIMKGQEAACKCCCSINELTFDHIIPLSKGGENSLENGQILCDYCNKLKDDEIISIENLKIKMESLRVKY